MATSGSFSTSAVGDFYFTFEWYRTGYNSSANEHYIHWTIYAHNTPGNYRTVYLRNLWIAGAQRYYEDWSVRYYDGDVVASGDLTIASSNSAGDGWFNAYFEAGIGTTSGANCSGEGSWDLDRIPRYTTVWNSERGKTVNTISVNWSTSDPRDWTQYSLNDGSWTDAYDTVAGDQKSGHYTVHNLQPNTTYKIRTRCRRADSGLWSEAGNIWIKTYDIAKINSVNNFNHGEDININTTNPGSISNLNLIMTVGETQIFSKTVNTGNNTITLSDEELDKLYKEYGSSNSKTATFVLSGGGYTNSATCEVTLTGNQKTIKTKLNDEWKRGKVYVKVSDEWKKAVVWTNVNGTWKRSI